MSYKVDHSLFHISNKAVYFCLIELLISTYLLNTYKQLIIKLHQIVLAVKPKYEKKRVDFSKRLLIKLILNFMTLIFNLLLLTSFFVLPQSFLLHSLIHMP